jgi:hypothetical protein
MAGDLSVYRFFSDGQWELVETFTNHEMAVRTATALTDSVSAKIGLTSRVIIMDDMDFTSFEWIKGRGLVFPTLGMRKDY